MNLPIIFPMKACQANTPPITSTTSSTMMMSGLIIDLSLTGSLSRGGWVSTVLTGFLESWTVNWRRGRSRFHQPPPNAWNSAAVSVKRCARAFTSARAAF